MKKPRPLEEIEATLRQHRLRKPAKTPEPRGEGKPPVEREKVIEVIRTEAAKLCGGRWDRPVEWQPIRAVLIEAGFGERAIRNGRRAAGWVLHPRVGRRMLYPADQRPSDAPVVVPAELVETVERGAVAIADELGVDVAEVVPEPQAPVMQPQPSEPEPPPNPRLLAVPIRLVVGIRPVTRETLAGHRIGTVGEALERGAWLDELVGSQQAERIRRYARGE
jgi:hypothetical protein